VHTERPRKTGTCRQRVRGLVLEEVNHGLGIKYTLWLDAARDRVLKTAFLNRVIYLAKASVKKEIRRASMDNSLFLKPTFPSKMFRLSYMKVKAVITTAGEPVSAESLNVPGQRFTGTVTDGLIDGCFEISHPRYDGKNAPAFPPISGPILARSLPAAGKADRVGRPRH